jgi:S-adenosylmethionine:tRNA ribosyltransferase-isomerase
MQLSDFSYDLPPDRIAQTPVEPRDHARLMLINRATGEISHHHVYNLPQLLPPNYAVIANNTKVFPARLQGFKPTGGKVEILLLSPLGHSSYRCISRPGLKDGDVVIFPVPTGSDLVGHPTRSDPQGYELTIHFDQDEATLRTTLSTIGTMPTPPYIKKMLTDQSRYQTIYAKYGFSAAAPTAGLHFTPDLLNTIKKDHKWSELTLNVGLGTFLPVKEITIEDHHMHSESYTLSATTAATIHLQRTDPCKKLLAIGTTTMRALEANPTLNPGEHTTSIFIYPPYQFKLVDALMTNFHLPESTLLMLVSAFCSSPQTNKPFTTFADSLLGRAYALAIREKYRFFSFGDAMLIL